MVSLFIESQTADYSPTKRTEAFWLFFDCYCRYVKRGIFISKQDDNIGWNTCRIGIKQGFVKEHLSGRRITGVIGGFQTRSLTLDFDFHFKDPATFQTDIEAWKLQARILVETFKGFQKCHFQVRSDRTTGMHFVFVWDRPQELDKVTKQVRGMLEDLDRQHTSPDAPPFSKIEIRPLKTDNGGMRLPFAKGRVMFLDKMVDPRDKDSLLYWAEWIQAPKPVNAEELLSYVFERLPETCPEPKKKETVSNIPSPSPTISPIPRPLPVPTTDPVADPATDPSNVVDPTNVSKGIWRGQTKDRLYDFFIEGKCHGLKPRAIIAVMGRVAGRFGVRQGLSESAVASMLHEFIEDLQGEALETSARLASGDSESFKREADVIVSAAYRGNKYQKQPDLSTEKLDGLLDACPTWNPVDKTTWSKPGSTVTKRRSHLALNWDAVPGLVTFCKTPLFTKDDVVVITFLNWAVNLVLDYRCIGWKFFRDGISEEIQEVKCRNKTKVLRLMNLLNEIGIWNLVKKGRSTGHGKGCSTWTLGWLAQQLTYNTPHTPCLYILGSHFSEEATDDDSEFERIVGTSDGSGQKYRRRRQNPTLDDKES